MSFQGKRVIQLFLFLTALYLPLVSRGWSSGGWAHSIVPFFKSSRYYLEGGGGIEWRRIRTRSQTVSQTPEWPVDRDTFTGSHSGNLLLLAGGLLWEREQRWFTTNSVGLEWAYGLPASVKGQVEQFSLPKFQDNYRLGYPVHHHTIRLTGKTDFYRWRAWMPYVEGGIGVTWNTAGDYNEHAAAVVTPRINPGFRAKVSTNFSYEVGGGLEYQFKKDMWVSIGYRYDWLGDIQTGKGVNTFTASQLHNKMYAHTVLARIRYAFC
jgi:hypothetical protein